LISAQASTAAVHPADPSLANSQAEIQKRLAAGRIPWIGPLGVIASRSIFIILAQSLVTLIFIFLRSPNPFKAATAWWQVSGSLVDIGCLALMFWFTRREGISLLDLIGLNKKKLGRDILLGLGILIVMFPIVMFGGAALAGLLIYGASQPVLPVEVMTKNLPLWAALYARTIWWLIWSVTEEMTYNGYALPRLQVLLGGRTWLAVLIVGVAWAFQHAFLPFLANWKVFLYLGLQMLPLVIVMQLLYLRFRRLPPTIIIHWGMDLISTILLISVISN
jgi:uncharacterized protein